MFTRTAHSTSDFPLILGDAVGREVRRAYESAPAAVLPASRRRTARDFRPQRRNALSAGAGLVETNEGGEVLRGTITEAEETYSLATFGRVFAITRQAIVNDDLGAFTDLEARMGRAAQELVASKLTGLVVDNPPKSDGLSVFHADHGNLVGTGAAPSVAEISGMFQMMRRQTGLAGEPINVTPRYLIVPPELEGTARQLAATINPTTVSDVNPWRLDVLVEARLTDPAAWYLAADPAVAEGLEHAFLSGAEGPVVDSRAGFDVDGVEIRVRLDFGAGWIDHRGWVRNPGA